MHSRREERLPEGKASGWLRVINKKEENVNGPSISSKNACLRVVAGCAISLCEGHINPGPSMVVKQSQALGRRWFSVLCHYHFILFRLFPRRAASFLLPLSLPLFITTLPLSRERKISRHVNLKSITAGEIKRGRKLEKEGHKNKTQKCGEKQEAKMMKEEGKQHKWEGESYFSGAKREVAGGDTKHTHTKLVICRVQRTSMHQTARGDGGGFVKCREQCGPLLRLPLPRTS